MASTNTDIAGTSFLDKLGDTFLSAVHNRYVDQETNDSEQIVPDYADLRTGNVPAGTVTDNTLKISAIVAAAALAVGVAFFVFKH